MQLDQVKMWVKDYRTIKGIIFFTLIIGSSRLKSQNDSNTKADTIKAVEIKVSKNLIENRADALVYNADEDLTSKGQSASELLSKVPMVDVDMDGNVSLRGNRNIRFLINGRPSGLLAGSPADALRAMSADDIATVEVITNPSSKYDAEGSGGIINIILKEKKVEGVVGNFRGGIGTRSAHLGGSLASQKGKTAYNLSLGSHFWRSWGNLETQRNNIDDQGISYQLIQKSDQVNWGGGPRLTLSLDHQFTKSQSLVLTATGRYRLRNSIDNWSTNWGVTDSVDFLWRQESDYLSQGWGYDLGFDYRIKGKNPKNEFAIAGLLTDGNSGDGYDALRFNSLNNLSFQEHSLNNNSNKEFSLQMDWVNSISEELLFETGLKTVLRWVTSNYHFDSFDFAKNTFVPNEILNNGFGYYQNVYAGYSQITYKFLKKYSARFGMRFEATEFGGNINKGTFETVGKNTFTGEPYYNWVPSISLSRVIGVGGYLRLNYNRRIQRPSLTFLNPYVNYSNPVNITVGNPLLDPEISENYEFSFGNYTKVGGFGLNFYHKRLNNAIETYRYINSSGVYVTTYSNIGKNIQNGMDLNLNFRGKGWMFFLNGGLGYVNISSTIDTGAVAGVSASGWTYVIGLRGNYSINENWLIEGFSRINAPQFSLQGYSQNWMFHTIGIKRTFNEGKGGLGIGLDNPFTPRVTLKTENKGQSFNLYSERVLNMWGVRINFNYSFGDVKTKKTNIRGIRIKNEDLKNGSGDGGM